MTFKNKPVAVLGAGRSGLAAARLLANLGAKVLVSDGGTLKAQPRVPRGVELETGGHSQRILDAELIVRSPGIPDHLAVLKQARQRKIPIWGELELASRLMRPQRMVAITGTNGKTTTTTLVGEFFKAFDKGTEVAGNIGTPLSDIAYKGETPSTLILELSSYQLENVETFHPTISAILNVTPDHLEHHGTMKAYAAAKARIFENQTAAETCVLNADDKICVALAKRCRAKVLWFSRRKLVQSGVAFRGGVVIVQWGKFNARFPLEWALPGPHNIENALAAIGIAVAGGVPLRVIQRELQRFKGVEHRLELVRTLRGVRYVNDSKATNVDSTRVALESFTQPLIVILGGEGKGSSYAPLKPLIKKQARRMLLIGEDAPTLRKELGTVVPYDMTRDMAGAVKRAARIAKPGDVVLLSPACASFDQYTNYEERGRHFKALVRQLK